MSTSPSLIRVLTVDDHALLREGIAALVNADKELGKTVPINHTPTLYVVSNKRAGKPFVEVVDRSQLYALIDSMLKE